MTRLALLAILLTSLLGAGAATAVATTGGLGHSTAATQGAASAGGSVQVKLNVTKFVKSGHRLVATGTAVGTYTSKSGKTTVSREPFTARVAVAPKGPKDPAACPVLTLQLDQLSLDLLGLHVDLSKVVLTITANPNEGPLGTLFCKVVTSSTPLGTTSTAHALTHAAQRSALSTSGVGVGVPTRQLQALGPGPCSIVDLLLGPL